MSQQAVSILLSEKISDRVIMLSKMWRALGRSTILIYGIDSLIYKDLSNFDTVIKVNEPKQAIEIAKCISGEKVVHYFCYGPDWTGLHLLHSGLKYIYDYKDLFWRVMNIEMPEDNGKLEMDLIKNAQLITNRDQQIINYINLNEITLNTDKLIHIPEYFHSDSKYEDELKKYILENNSETIHAVITGGYPEDNDIPISEGIREVIKYLLAQNIKVTVIGSNSNINKIDVCYSTNDNEIEKNKNYRAIPMMEQEEYEGELIKYDFAVHLTNEDIVDGLQKHQFKNSVHASYAGSARLLSFVKAGLPILISSRFKYNIERFNKSDFIMQFNKEKNYYNLVKEMRESKFRKRLLVDREIYNTQHLLNYAKEIFN